MKRVLACLLLWPAIVLAEAEAVPEAPAAETAVDEPKEYPRIVAIDFEGNGTTQPKVMLREMLIQVGDLADPKLIKRSAQYVQDLGLFRWVKVREEPVDGGVRLVFMVDEKWYILPYPKFSATVEGQNSTGAELRWANVWGLNHSLRINALRSDFKQEDRGRETSYSASYAAPYAFDSPYRVSVSAEYTESPVTAPVSHEETFRYTSVFVSRTFPDEGGARSQGTTYGAGLFWQKEHREGEGVPEPYGQATGLSASYGYRNVRFYSYSEEGVGWRVSGSGAREGMGSDYSFIFADASYYRYIRVGETPHQQFNYSFSTGTYSYGPKEIQAYSFGGSGVLRGYEVNSLEGNFYYLATAEFFRPVFWPSLRLGAILEAGRVFENSGDFNLDGIDSSLGIALRWRVTRFVNLEVEFGYAIPLNGGGGKIFGGRV